MRSLRSPREVTITEGNTRASVRGKYGEDIVALAGNQPGMEKTNTSLSLTHGEDVKDRRSSQAVACMKRCTREPGRPIRLLGIDRECRYSGTKGKPGNRTMRKPKSMNNQEGKPRRNAEEFWLGGSRIKHSNPRRGKPATW